MPAFVQFSLALIIIWAILFGWPYLDPAARRRENVGWGVVYFTRARAAWYGAVTLMISIGLAGFASGLWSWLCGTALAVGLWGWVWFVHKKIGPDGWDRIRGRVPPGK